MRMLQSTFLGGLLFAGFTTVAACGSDVNEGSGGSGSASSAVSTTGSTSSTGGGDGKQACADLCHAREVNNCGGPLGDCNTDCDAQFASIPAECVDELGAVFTCNLPFFENGACPEEAPSECASVEEAFQACEEANGCVGDECYNAAGRNGDMECGCSMTCQKKLYATSCKTTNGSSSCDCMVEGTSVGTCIPEAGAGEMCSVDSGCCNTYFKLQ